MIRKQRVTVGRVLALTLLAGLAACDDSTSPNDPGPPPQLPPLTSMSGDFGFFGDQAVRQAELPLSASSTALNFTNAALRVLAARPFSCRFFVAGSAFVSFCVLCPGLTANSSFDCFGPIEPLTALFALTLF